MTSTVSYHPAPPEGTPPGDGGEALLARYREVAAADELGGATRHRKLRLLGTGGQGAVYLARRLGADGFARHVSLKVFSPESYRDARAYERNDRSNGGGAEHEASRTKRLVRPAERPPRKDDLLARLVDRFASNVARSLADELEARLSDRLRM